MAILSLLALVIAIILTSLIEINIGIVAIAFAFVLGFLTEGLTLPDLMGDFPSYLFLTLLGVTLLFGQAQQNGTLEKITQWIVFLFRGNTFWIPICFFFLTLGLAAIGAGNIAATALVAPTAMASAKKLKISPFLMALMVANGANAGGLSPLAPTGIIAAERMSQIGLTNLSWIIFFNSFIAQMAVAFCGYMLFGGRQLLGRNGENWVETGLSISKEQWERKHWITLAVLILMFLSVVWFNVDIVVGSFVGVAFLSISRVSDDTKAIKHVPWSIIVMVCGVSMLTAMMDKAGGIELFTTYVAKICNAGNVNGIIGFFAALVSVYSSSSAVVLPTFLLFIPQLISKIPGADPVSLASSISISAHLVDVSPLSTIGALCLASVADAGNNRQLFRQMLMWGLSMTVVAGIFCRIFF